MKRILVIDDDLDYLCLLTKILGDRYVVNTATEAEEGLDCLRSRRPDLILLDMMLPGKSGIDILRLLQAEDDSLRSIPVVLMTARRFDAGMRGFLEGEPNVKGYLPKPLDLRGLGSFVESRMASA